MASVVVLESVVSILVVGPVPVVVASLNGETENWGITGLTIGETTEGSNSATSSIGDMMERADSATSPLLELPSAIKIASVESASPALENKGNTASGVLTVKVAPLDHMASVIFDGLLWVVLAVVDVDKFCEVAADAQLWEVIVERAIELAKSLQYRIFEEQLDDIIELPPGTWA
jgi:hypothetical protein